MREKKILTWPVILLIILAPYILRPIYSGVVNILGHNEDDVRQKIEEYLYEKYGEEFMVDMIGTRSSRGEEFYQARIYPKSIIGTNKEGDDYYYASATVEKKSFGRLGGVGDSYSYVYRNMDVENYLLPEAKKIFGERILLKVDVAHKVTGDGSWWAGYKSISLAEMRRDIKEDPERNRIELELYVYIFNRIDDEVEKEKRRKQIFDFVQYLKKEGLFNYLELGVIFIDERVLAPSYRRYKYDLNYGEKIKEVVEGEEVYLPSMELRKEMSQVLQEEIDRMSKEELLANMREIRKSELSALSSDGLGYYNMHYMDWIMSIEMMKVSRKSSYEEKKRKNLLDRYDYNSIRDIKLSKNKNYIYVNK